MRPPCVPLPPPSASPLDGCVPPGGRRRTRRSDGNVDPFAQVIALHLGVALCPPLVPPVFAGQKGGGTLSQGGTQKSELRTPRGWSGGHRHEKAPVRGSNGGHDRKV